MFITNQTRRMYIDDERHQDGQGFNSTRNATSPWWRHCSETFSAITSLFFRRRSKRIPFLDSVNFSTCVCMQIFIFRDGHMTTFRQAVVRGAISCGPGVETEAVLTFEIIYLVSTSMRSRVARVMGLPSCQHLASCTLPLESRLRLRHGTAGP